MTICSSKTLTWDRRPRGSSWMQNKCESWNGSSHWTLGKEVLHTASPHHLSEAASGQENSSSLQTWPTLARRCSPPWTLWCQGCWAWRPVLQAPTSLWPTESQRYLKEATTQVLRMKNKTNARTHACKHLWTREHSSWVALKNNLPAWWKPSESPPQPENTSSVRYLGTLSDCGSVWESCGSCAAEAFPLPLPWRE